MTRRAIDPSKLNAREYRRRTSGGRGHGICSKRTLEIFYGIEGSRLEDCQRRTAGRCCPGRIAGIDEGMKTRRIVRAGAQAAAVPDDK